MIETQWCWWCGRGPWRALPIHTWQAHGITSDDIRRMGGLFKGTPTISATLSDTFRIRTLNAGSPGLVKANAAPYPRKKRVMSEAGAKANAARLAAYAKEHPEQHSQAARRAAELSRKPHPCSACGKEIPTAAPITCSPECRREIRVRTARRVSEQRYQTK